MAIRQQKLSPKQQRFVSEYAVDCNATQAATRAGYSPRTANEQGARLLAKVSVQEAIAAARSKTAMRLEITVERVVQEIARIAFADPRRLFKPDGTLKAITELDDDTAATVASIEVSEIYEGTGDQRKLVGVLKKMKQWDKNSALDKLCKRLGLYDDRSTTNVNVTTIDWSTMYQRPKVIDTIAARIAEVEALPAPASPGESGAGGVAGSAEVPLPDAAGPATPPTSNGTMQNGEHV